MLSGMPLISGSNRSQSNQSRSIEIDNSRRCPILCNLYLCPTSHTKPVLVIPWSGDYLFSMAQLTEQRHDLRSLSNYQPGKKALLAFFETDCPTCQLTLPYLNALSKSKVQVIALSQDDEASTKQFVQQMGISYPVAGSRSHIEPCLQPAIRPHALPVRRKRCNHANIGWIRQSWLE